MNIRTIIHFILNSFLILIRHLDNLFLIVYS